MFMRVREQFVNLSENYSENYLKKGKQKLTRKRHSLLMRYAAKEMKSTSQFCNDLGVTSIHEMYSTSSERF